MLENSKIKWVDVRHTTLMQDFGQMVADDIKKFVFSFPLGEHSISLLHAGVSDISRISPCRSQIYYSHWHIWHIKDLALACQSIMRAFILDIMSGNSSETTNSKNVKVPENKKSHIPFVLFYLNLKKKKARYVITGPESLSQQDLLRIFGKVIESEIVYVKLLFYFFSGWKSWQFWHFL